MGTARPTPAEKYSRIMRPFWFHVYWFLAVALISVFGAILVPWDVTSAMVEDTSKTLLALNGTLLALVVAFATLLLYNPGISSERHQSPQALWVNTGIALQKS